MSSLAENKKIDRALDFVTQSRQPDTFFVSMVRLLAELLQIDCVLVASVSGSGDVAQTISVFAEPQYLENFSYPLCGTPCATVLPGALCYYESGLQQRFPRVPVLIRLQAESYMGIALRDATGNAIGLIALLNRGRIEDAQTARTILQIVALRTTSELQLQNHAIALQQSEEKFRSLFENAGDAIYLIDPHSARIVDANVVACNMLGFDKHEFHNMHISDIDMQASESSSRNWSVEFLSAGRAERFERVHRAKNGAQVAVEIQASIVDIAGRKLIQAYVRDLRHSKQLEAQLLQSQKMQAIGTLAGGIAHDFNNILMSISGFSELALMECQDGKVRSRLKNIFDACQRANKLVSQILAFSRKAPQKTEIVPLARVVSDCVTMLRVSFPPPVEIRSRYSQSAAVLGDATQLEQAIMNICTNAAHSLKSPHGIITLELTTTTLSTAQALALQIPDGNYACLKISDDGVGIDASILPRIFEPFFTTKEPGKGTGLGLSMAHGIVKSHHGAIVVDSHPGAGSTFTLLLPQVETTANPAVSGGGVHAGVNGNGRLLVVDDETQLLRVLQAALVGAGYDVDAHANPVEAFNAFAAAPDGYAAVITDEAMPIMRGGELIDKIRKIRGDIPILLCTGYVDASSVSKNQPVVFLQKPFSLSTLLSSLSEQIGGATAHAQTG